MLRLNFRAAKNLRLCLALRVAVYRDRRGGNPAVCFLTSLRKRLVLVRAVLPGSSSWKYTSSNIYMRPVAYIRSCGRH